jgi:formamidopyrimidine-DNA glycosylase
MPELPDIEIFKRYVDATSLHQKIGKVGVRNEKVLGAVSARKLQGTLKGRSFDSTRRQGKNLFVKLDDGGWMLMHFGMTGSLAYFENPDDEPPHSRLLFTFENGYHLAFDDGRMFGRVDLIEDPEAFARDRELGPDPLDLDAVSFRERLRKTRGGIKATLMNQKMLAGIGNLYSDEILFQARIHPRTSVAQLDDPTLENLHKETLRVLNKAIEQEAYPQELPDSFLLSHRQEGARCPRGNGQIQKIKAAGRTAYLCPTCQRARSG